jgi:hypothetical protein
MIYDKKWGFFCVSLNLSCCLTLSGLSQRPKIAIFTRCISGPPISHPVLPYAWRLEPDSWHAHRPCLWPCLGATRIKFFGRLRGCLGQFWSRGGSRIAKKISFFSIIKVQGPNSATGGARIPTSGIWTVNESSNILGQYTHTEDYKIMISTIIVNIL